MIIFNDVGLTIKGFYQEAIDHIQRKKILDRLYNLIHRELFEGVLPLEETTTVSTMPVLMPKVKRTYKKHKHRKNRKPEIEMLNVPEPIEPDISNQQPNPIPNQEFKDSVYDNEEDNQYSEMKKKGLI